MALFATPLARRLAMRARVRALGPLPRAPWSSAAIPLPNPGLPRGCTRVLTRDARTTCSRPSREAQQSREGVCKQRGIRDSVQGRRARIRRVASDARLWGAAVYGSIALQGGLNKDRRSIERITRTHQCAARGSTIATRKMFWGKSRREHAFPTSGGCLWEANPRRLDAKFGRQAEKPRS